MGTRRIIQSSHDLALAAAAVEVATLPAKATVVAAPAAITATVAASVGGTGATEGAWDTAAHRNTVVTAVNALEADVAALQVTLTALIANLKTAGLVATS